MDRTAVQYGVGPIGARLVETAADRGYAFVGAVDVDPGKVGAALGEVAGLDGALSLGLLAAYPVNVLLIRHGVKEGMMDPREVASTA